MTRRTIRRLVELILGFSLGAALLWLFFRGLSWAELRQGVLAADLSGLLVVLGLNLLSQLVRTLRWQLLLNPLSPSIGFWAPFRFFNIGLALSALIPGRPGELVRPYLVSRDQGVAFTAALATVVVERVLDLLAVLVLLASGFVLPGVLGPRAEEAELAGLLATLRGSGLALFAVVSLALAFLILLQRRRDRATALVRWLGRPLPAKLTTRLVALLEAFADGLDGLKGASRRLQVLALSALIWAIFIASYHFALEAFHLSVPLSGLPFFVAVLALGVAVPTPAGMGTFHAAFLLVIGGLWGLGEAQSGAVAGCALVSHALATAPVVALGVLFLAQEGLGVLRAAEAARDGAEEGRSR